MIFPAGTEIALEIRNALKYSKFVNLIGGTSMDDHSDYVYKTLIKGFPFIDEEGFLDYLNDVVREYQIDSIYPAHDSVGVFLSKHRDEIPTQIIITEDNTVSICRSKKMTYEFLKKESYIPEVYDSADEVTQYPVFAKPDVGQGSNGISMVENEREFSSLQQKGRMVFCEYLPGDECTVDCLTDAEGRLIVVKSRERKRIRNGISVRATISSDDSFIREIAESLNEKLVFKGAWFFQLKKDKNNKYKLLEVSPRIPGTMGLTRNLGINFPMITLFIFWGYKVGVIDNGYDISVDRALISAYQIGIDYKHVYLDYDDTLIVKGKVNELLMYFLYQCRNNNKKIHLLTKHIGDIHEELKKFGISEELFEDIIVLSDDKQKPDYINKELSIFIDDSFAERKRVRDICNIPVFDIDMVESLIDYKR